MLYGHFFLKMQLKLNRTVKNRMHWTFPGSKSLCQCYVVKENKRERRISQFVSSGTDEITHFPPNPICFYVTQASLRTLRIINLHNSTFKTH